MAPETANAVQYVIAGTAVQHAVIQPQQTTAAARPVAEEWEVRLIKKAICRMVPRPNDPQEAVEFLLDRLHKRREVRRLRGLDHWQGYAPKFLDRLMSKFEAQRRVRIGRFIQTNHEQFLRYALAITRHIEEAEDAVAETETELLEGRTTEKHFYRALWANARNRVKALAKQVELFDSLDAPPYVADADGVDGLGDEGISFAPKQLVSARKEDWDPLEILLEQEEIKRGIRQASSRRKHWWIRQTKWGQTLGIGEKSVSEKSVSGE